MPPYICVTYADSRRKDTEALGSALARYGFRYACMSEQTSPEDRGELLCGASLLIACTSLAAAEAETVAADIRRALERGMSVLCVSLEENPLDDRFCTAGGGATLIPVPMGETPDRHSVALFVHRLFVRHLARLADCFSSVRCVDDVYGHAVLHAVAAYRGDPLACYGLGIAYERGEGVPALEGEAARWISAAAEAGVPDARIRMGQLRLTGRGTERNPAEAFRLFTLSAEEGDVRGEYHCGLCYLEGLGVMKDPEQALRYLTVAAQAGYPPALYRLGLLYREGIGTKPDHRAAVRCLYHACRLGMQLQAEKGRTDEVPLHCPLTLMGHADGAKYKCISMRRLRRTRVKPMLRARLQDGGKVLSEASLDARIANSFARCRMTAVYLPEDEWLGELFDTAASTSEEASSVGLRGKSVPAEFDPARAAVALGSLLAQGDEANDIHPHPTRALVWYRLALRMGGADALYHLGDAYRCGWGLPADPTRAFHLFRLAAAMGNERSRFALGVCYEQGIGTLPDPDRAFACYEQSARAGYPPAQNNLGGCYEHGLGTAQDIHAAAEWYARAAAEEPVAACRLGLCYEQGRGVNPDAMKAFRLYETAAKAGCAYAQYRLGLCYDRGVEEGTTDTPNHNDTRPARLSIAPNYSRATHFLKQAAEGGVADAAYALSLCYRSGRGVRRDGDVALRYLRDAAQGGSIPACYRLGLTYLEGDCAVQDAARAVSCFAKAATLWAESGDCVRRNVHPGGILTLKGLTPIEAAGGALYMLGYCALYGIGDCAHPAISVRKMPPTPQERVNLAADCFREAARLDCVSAITALGDLYAYRLLTPETASAEDESLHYYMEAARVGTARESVSDTSDDSPIDAMMSLVTRSSRVAESCATEGDAGSAELARVQAWRNLAGCAEQGSIDAYVTMAACAWHGYGTPENPDAAVWFLEHAEETAGGRVTASLWLGDLYRVGKVGEPSPEQADAAYLRAIRTPDLESECGRYTIRERREARLALDRRARAEALYRLATLRAVNFAEGDSYRESFPYLVKAIQLGHETALDDLARMYAYESAYINSTAPKGRGKKSPSPTVGGAIARRRLGRRTPDSSTPRDSRAGRSHQGWMSNYYTALWLTPELFSYGMYSASAPSDRPDYVTAPVTDTMRAAALNYLGDCLYYGNGLPPDVVSAADCYRKVVEMRIPMPRGATPPMGVVWAQYSYGWCLLHGIGTAPNPREAVKHLTAASRYHAEACYCLGSCYEEGIGVDGADEREAVKYYRKAYRLGYRKAALKVAELEKRLKAEA